MFIRDDTKDGSTELPTEVLERVEEEEPAPVIPRPPTPPPMPNFELDKLLGKGKKRKEKRMNNCFK